MLSTATYSPSKNAFLDAKSRIQPEFFSASTARVSYADARKLDSTVDVVIGKRKGAAYILFTTVLFQVNIVKHLAQYSESSLPWLYESKRLELEGSPHKAMDFLYRGMDELLKNGRWDLIDTVFDRMDAKSDPINTIAGVLISTRRCKTRLSRREGFIAKFRQRIESDGRNPDAVLKGLE